MQDHNDALGISLQKFKQYDVHPHNQRLLDRMTSYAAELVHQSMCISAIIRAGPVCGSAITAVNAFSGVSATVDIARWTCTCQTFTAYRLPCSHVIAAATRICYRIGSYVI